jgi:alanine dehydrogenase
VGDAIGASPALARGVNVTAEALTYEAVAIAHGLPYTPLEDALAGASLPA